MNTFSKMLEHSVVTELYVPKYGYKHKVYTAKPGVFSDRTNLVADKVKDHFNRDLPMIDCIIKASLKAKPVSVWVSFRYDEFSEIGVYFKKQIARKVAEFLTVELTDEEKKKKTIFNWKDIVIKDYRKFGYR